MRMLKILAITVFIVALMGWAMEPAEETQEIQPTQKIEVTCERDYITVKPASFQLSQFSNEKAKWHFVGSGPKSVGACTVGGIPLKENLKKIEIGLSIPAWAGLKYPKLLSLTYPAEPWQDGVDYEIEGEIGEEQLEEDEIRIEYSIRFLGNDGRLLLERKGFEIKLVPAIECAVHPGSAKNKDGDYNSITQALNDTARQCEKIVVEPGEYEENPTIEPRSRRLIIEASGEERKPTIKAQLGREMNQIFFLKKASNVTIEGLHIMGGNIGILVQRSHGITIRNVKVFKNEEAGIRVIQSGERGIIKLEEIEAYDNGKATNRERKGGIVIIDSNVTIDNSTVRNNEVSGVSIIDIPEKWKIIISNTKIRENNGDGIFIKNAAVDLQQNSIVRNGNSKGKTGCGIKVEGYPPPTDSLGRTNLIIANGPDPIDNYPRKVNEKNICSPDVAAIRHVVRKTTIEVPQDVNTLQEAIYESEPRRASEDPTYEVVIEGELLDKPLCIDRSVIIRSRLTVTLRPPKAIAGGPLIDIASQECPLIEEIPTYVQVQGPLEGSLILDGSGKASAGFRIGTQHRVKDPKREVSLKVELRNIIIQNSESGIKVSTEENKRHSLTVQLLGSTDIKDAACNTSIGVPQLPTAHNMMISNNGVGISVDIPEEPEGSQVRLEVKNTFISGNKGAGLKIASRRTKASSSIEIQKSWVQGNAGVGLAAESRGKMEIEIQDTRLWENTRGGILLKADDTDASQMTANLTNIDIRGNEGFGIEIAGAVTATLKADAKESDPKQMSHGCWIGENLGPGVYIHAEKPNESANVNIENLFILRNGFEEKGGWERQGKAKARDKDQKIGPDGIFAKGFINLTVRNNLIGLYGLADSPILNTGNAGVGILLFDVGLLATKPEPALTAKIEGNYIKWNRKWGVAYVSQGCLSDIQVDYRVAENAGVSGKENEIRDNGKGLSEEEKKYGHGEQVCPDISKLTNLKR